MQGYKFYGKVNLAETWRDPDEIKYFAEQIFTDFDKVSNYAINFINSKISDDKEKIRKIELDAKGSWHYSFMGSWAPTYYIETVEIN